VKVISALFATLLILHLNGLAAEPGQPSTPSLGDSAESRIVIRDGSFVDAGTNKPFRPFGVNYYRVVLTAEGKQYHSALSDGSYDEAFVTRMMEHLARDKFNTIRTFLSNHSGPGGIVAEPESADIAPGYLANLIHFLRSAQAHRIRVILAWDTWPPQSHPWARTALDQEARHGFVLSQNVHFGVNGFRLSPEPVRSKANAICALINALRKSAPELLPVVLAWELENEAHFRVDQEPFLSRPSDFTFGGRRFDLRDDSGAQELMDASARAWATACADAIHATDPGALVSASVFTFAAVGRRGPGTLSADRSSDHRVPARPLALLESGIDFVDLHLYAGRSEQRTVPQHLEHDLESIEISALGASAKRLGKPILVGESGIAAHFTRRGPDWQTIRHEEGAALLREFYRRLAAHPFAGVLHWHYGSLDSTAQDEFPAMHLFTVYPEALKSSPFHP
jgi:hypothetical protein